MSSQRKPKVLLFDIGGVCVVSPFQAILDYEKQNSIPKGYINYAISASKPNGAWHQAERGELALDDAWFAAFKSDLERPTTWQRFHDEKLKKRSSTAVPPPSTIPAIPTINAETLYWTMMSTARTPDPYMAPALQRLRKSNAFHLAALSNTTIFPEGHEFNNPTADDVRHNFDVFVSSAHVGMRKPNRDIYEYAMTKLREKWPESDIQNGDVVFLDDIGENLKMGREMGWRTVRVLLGRTDEAVRELEGLTGLELLVDRKDKSKL